MSCSTTVRTHSFASDRHPRIVKAFASLLLAAQPRAMTS
jgi:hypothetical protein